MELDSWDWESVDPPLETIVLNEHGDWLMVDSAGTHTKPATLIFDGQEYHNPEYEPIRFPKRYIVHSDGNLLLISAQLLVIGGDKAPFLISSRVLTSTDRDFNSHPDPPFEECRAMRKIIQ